MRYVSLLLAVLGSVVTAGPASGQGIVRSLVSPNAQVDGAFGKSISIAGDVDLDGFSDVLVGASHESPGASPDYAGRVYLFSGADGHVLRTLASPNEQEDSRFGCSVAIVGDTDGDGRCDILIGARWEDHEAAQAGRAYLFSGHTGELLRTLVSPTPQSGGSFGDAVAGLGDVNDDGHPDLVVGASWLNPWSAPTGEGRAYVFGGSDGALIHVLESPAGPGGFFGNPVAGTSDIDGDGCDDILVGAWRENPDSSPGDAGRAYVFSGRTGTVIHAFSSPNEEANGWFGAGIAGLDDLDGDGVAEILVGAPQEDPGSSPRDNGRAYVFSGGGGALLMPLSSPTVTYRGQFGWCGSGVPDIDGDGVPEFAVAAFESHPNGTELVGRVHIFSGATGTAILTIDSPNPTAGGAFGCALSSAGDMTGDGVRDLAVGGVFEQVAGMSQAGRAYVFDLTITAIRSDRVHVPLHVHIDGPYPNPTRGDIAFSLDGGTEDHEPLAVMLLDPAARCVCTLAGPGFVAGGGTDVHLRIPRDLPSGTYVLRVASGSQAVDRTVLVIR